MSLKRTSKHESGKTHSSRSKVIHSRSHENSFKNDKDKYKEENCGETVIPLTSLIGQNKQLSLTAIEALDWNTIKTMLPSFLQRYSKEDVALLVTEELDVMSRKRILSVLEGREMCSSSSEEDSDADQVVDGTSSIDVEKECDRVSLSASSPRIEARRDSPHIPDHEILKDEEKDLFYDVDAMLEAPFAAENSDSSKEGSINDKIDVERVKDDGQVE